MSENPKIAWLHAVFAELGIRTTDGITPWSSEGYPVVVPLPEGEQMVIDLPEPGILSQLDPQRVGVVIADGYGRVKRAWGIASRVELLTPGATLLDSPLANLVEAAALNGESGSLFLDGHRYFSASARAGRAREVILLVCEADEEREVRVRSTHNARTAELFRRIGRALSMHQTLNELSVLAVHEIASACGLAAALLWARTGDEEKLTLRAHVGINRQGAKALVALDPEHRLSCAAELAATKKQAFWVHNVSENALTQHVEARICYLQPQTLVALPLMVGDRLVGVLELVARDGDTSMTEARDTYETLAEHIALALNTTLMFESIERMANFDPLTGVANHRALIDFLNARLSEADRNGAHVGMLMIDVDHFRSFNEEEGHDAGDFVLKEVAKRLRDAVRPYDLAARYGGEEFSVVLPGLDLQYSYDVAERIRKAIERIEYVTASGRIRHVTASIGVSSFPETTRESQALQKAADVALFRAKRGGRNRTVTYDGVFREEPKTAEAEDASWLEKWQSPEDKPRAEALWKFVEPYARSIGEHLQLSKPQSVILEHLVRIYPTYKRLMAQNDPSVMRMLELAAEFRPLLPSLMTMNERFDGAGPMQMKAQKIPLLARILSVLMVLAEERGQPLVSDPNRFDPDIIGMLVPQKEGAA